MDENTNTIQTQEPTAAKTKFCKHCGAKIPEAAVICTACGCQVEELKSGAGFGWALQPKAHEWFHGNGSAAKITA